MTNITQKVRSITTRTITMAFLVSIGLLTFSSAQAAKKDTGGGGGSAYCPCFTSTIIDATIAEGGGSGVGGLLNGTDGGFTCGDDGDEVFLRFDNLDRSMSISVFGDLTYGSIGPRCGWSGRPINITTQEASECQDQIKQSWAWQVLGCPNL